MLTETDRNKISELLKSHEIISGLGTSEASCSLGYINLALTGRLTDVIPACMSPVIAKWIIGVQDAMPPAMRNSPEWREALPFAAGTGRDHEPERFQIILDWMWGTVLPVLQPLADKEGFGEAWRRMCEERTEVAALSAQALVEKKPDDAMVSVRGATCRATGITRGATSGHAALSSASVARFVVFALTAETSDIAAKEIEAATWSRFDPIALLRRLIAVSETDAPAGHAGAKNTD